MVSKTEAFVEARQVFVGVEASSKDEALRFLADEAGRLGFGDADGIYEAFLAREALGTTGIENGLAIPHAKSLAVTTPAVCLAKFVRPVEWGAMDGQPVTVAVALFVPEAAAGTTHLRLLSRVAVLAGGEDFAPFIAGCDDAEEIAAYLTEGIGA